MIALAGVLEFNVSALAEGLALPESDAIAFFRDGRHAQPLMERKLLHAFGANAWRVVSCVGGGRKLVDPRGERFDVRAVVREVSFAPSFMKGTGRRFEETAFFDYYRAVAGVFVVDVAAFPRCPYWRVHWSEVTAWARTGVLEGSRARIDRWAMPNHFEGFKP